MENLKSHVTQRQAAIVSGLSIIVMTIGAVMATDVTIGSLFVSGDAAETAANIQNAPLAFRVGVFSWLVVLICDILAAWGLYIFLKPVNKGLSLLSAWFRLIYAAILAAAIVNLLDVLLLTNAGNNLVISTTQLQNQLLVTVTAFYDVWSFGLIIFGIHILLLGWLVFRSGYMPKTLGLLLMLAFVGYVVVYGGKLLLPGQEKFFTLVGWIFIIPMLSEVALGVWFLVRGVKVKR